MMEMPTRKPSALAIPRDLAVCDEPPRSMKNRAAAKLPRMATKAKITRNVMGRIIT